MSSPWPTKIESKKILASFKIPDQTLNEMRANRYDSVEARGQPGADEKFVKRNLERIILSLLKHQPLCGHDIIKIIFQRFSIPVSHGRVYPLLYSLESRGMLRGEVQKGAKVKVYSLSERGIELIRSRSVEFREIKKYLGL